MKKIVLLTSIFIAITLTGCASNSHYVENKQYRSADVYATVVSSNRLPDQCNSKSSGTTGVVVGTAIGALIGNQFGSGDGRKAMTVAGAAVGGSVVAASNENKQNQYNCYSSGFNTQIKFVNPNTGHIDYTTIITDRQHYSGSTLRTRIKL